MHTLEWAKSGIFSTRKPVVWGTVAEAERYSVTRTGGKRAKIEHDAPFIEKVPFNDEMVGIT